jgi:hypothetical protein
MELGLPKGIKINNDLDGLKIIRDWFSRRIVMLTFFALIWDSFLVFWYVTTLQQPNPEIVALLFPVIHLIIGIGMTYYVLCGYLNQTFIRVNYNTLSIKHGPLPYPGNRTFDTTDIKQIYSKESVAYSRRGRSTSYELRAVTHSGRNVKLLGGLTNSEQALFIEQEVEKYLGIHDVPVRGEISR